MICKNCGRENPPEAVFCSNCGARLVATTGLVPGVGSSFGHGWQALKKNFWELILAGVIFLALMIPVAIILGLVFYFTTDQVLYLNASLPRSFLHTASWELQLSSSIVSIVYYTPITFGLMFVYLGAVRGEKVEYGNIFAAFQNYLDVILVGVLYTVVSGGVSFLLTFFAANFPVPGALLSLAWAVFLIFLFCRLAFVPYLLLDRKLKAIEAISTSWNMTAGHGWKVFFIGLLAVLMLIAVAILSFIITLIFFWLPFIGIFLGILAGAIGSIVVAMWVLTAYGSLYHAVSSAAPAVNATKNI
jgi:hypothetical protein